MTAFIAAVDPGQTTGCAVMNATGVVDAWQDETWASLRRLVGWVRENRSAVGMVGIEDCFLGKGVSASLSIARSGGRVEGALVIAGYPADRIVLMLPSVWRSEAGIKGKDRNEKEAAGREYAKRLTGRSFTVPETHMAEAICMAWVTWTRFARSLPTPLMMRTRT